MVKKICSLYMSNHWPSHCTAHSIWGEDLISLSCCSENRKFIQPLLSNIWNSTRYIFLTVSWYHNVSFLQQIPSHWIYIMPIFDIRFITMDINYVHRILYIAYQFPTFNSFVHMCQTPWKSLKSISVLCTRVLDITDIKYAHLISRLCLVTISHIVQILQAFVLQLTSLYALQLQNLYISCPQPCQYFPISVNSCTELSTLPDLAVTRSSWDWPRDQCYVKFWWQHRDADYLLQHQLSKSSSAASSAVIFSPWNVSSSGTRFDWKQKKKQPCY